MEMRSRCLVPVCLVFTLLSSAPLQAGFFDKLLDLVPTSMQDADLQKLLAERGGVYEDPGMKARLDRIVAQLKPYMDGKGRKTPIQAYLVDNATVNAGATPSGILVMHRGMMDATAGHDGMLAAVVGHELGHVDCQHGITQWILHIALDAVTHDDKWLKVLASLIFGRRSQKDEFQADRCGMRYMLLTGYEPDGALRLQQKFVELFGAGAGVNSYFSTHPPGPMRVAKLRAALPVILLNRGQEIKTARKPETAIAHELGTRPKNLSTQLTKFMTKSGQMAPTALGPHKSLEEAMTSANRAGFELLVWCKASRAGKKKAPVQIEVSVYDLPTGLLLTDKMSQPNPQTIALALLANRNWRHGGGLAFP